MGESCTEMTRRQGGEINILLLLLQHIFLASGKAPGRGAKRTSEVGKLHQSMRSNWPTFSCSPCTDGALTLETYDWVMVLETYDWVMVLETYDWVMVLETYDWVMVLETWWGYGTGDIWLGHGTGDMIGSWYWRHMIGSWYGRHDGVMVLETWWGYGTGDMMGLWYWRHMIGWICNMRSSTWLLIPLFSSDT